MALPLRRTPPSSELPPSCGLANGVTLIGKVEGDFATACRPRCRALLQNFPDPILHEAVGWHAASCRNVCAQFANSLWKASYRSAWLSPRLQSRRDRHPLRLAVAVTEDPGRALRAGHTILGLHQGFTHHQR